MSAEAEDSDAGSGGSTVEVGAKLIADERLIFEGCVEGVEEENVQRVADGSGRVVGEDARGEFGSVG